jgi:hypothetical protein
MTNRISMVSAAIGIVISILSHPTVYIVKKGSGAAYVDDTGVAPSELIDEN